MGRVVVTADDYGLSRGVTDTILEVADQGALTRASLLPNGLAFDYAIAEYKKRAERFELSAHLNLTEGRPLSASHEIPQLVDGRGFFKHSPFSLLAASSFRGGTSPICMQIRLELTRQLERMRDAGASFCVDGHQHIHMVPAVFRELLAIAPRYGVISMRVPYESFGILSALFLHPLRSLQVAVLNYLSVRNIMRARERFSHNDWFIGVLDSGRLSTSSVQRFMSHTSEKGALEIAAHPGSALPGELVDWSGDTQWHYSPNRQNERAMLCSGDFKTLVASDVRGTSTHVSRVKRFIIAGSTAAATHLFFLYLLTEYVRMWYLLSATVGWGAAFLVSFMLQKFFTFDEHSAFHGRQVIRYFVLQIANLALNTIGVLVLTSLGLWYMAAQFIVLLALAVWSYIVAGAYIFKV